MIWLGALLIVIAVLFLVFPQKMGSLVAVILAGIGIIILIMFIDSYRTKEAEESVSITVSYAPASCGENLPLHFKITNRSKKVVNKVKWDITATRKGYSSNIIQYGGYLPYSSDKMLKPGESYSGCYGVPFIGDTPPQNLIWKVKNHKSIEFQ